MMLPLRCTPYRPEPNGYAISGPCAHCARAPVFHHVDNRPRRKTGRQISPWSVHGEGRSGDSIVLSPEAETYCGPPPGPPEVAPPEPAAGGGGVLCIVFCCCSYWGAAGGGW